MDYYTICAICGKCKRTAFMDWFLLSGREQLACYTHKGYKTLEDQEAAWEATRGHS